MAACELLKGCLFFNEEMPDPEGLAALYKRRYCQNEFSKCARHRVATTVGRQHVPRTLYPNMAEQAEDIIRRQR